MTNIDSRIFSQPFNIKNYFFMNRTLGTNYVLTTLGFNGIYPNDSDLLGNIILSIHVLFQVLMESRELYRRGVF